MNVTRVLMSASALSLAAIGLFGLFAPDVLLSVSGVQVTPAAMVIAQLAGVLYLGFAALNWMARGSLIGGIYARPVAIGNVLHFVSGAIVLFKALSSETLPASFWIVAAIYAVFAVAFSSLLRRSPVPSSRPV